MAKVENSVNLLVPMHLDAMVVNNNLSPLWKDTSMNLGYLDDYTYCRGLGYYLEKKATEGPDADKDGDLMPTGIHLHWTLPDALRKGKLKSDKSTIIFPPAPNRWLINRMDGEQQFRSWIVESDRLNEAHDPKLNWIKDTTTQKNGIEISTLEAIAIGNVLPFADWDEPGKGEIELTVIAPGNPEFAASYMNCRNVFGFYDDMKDEAGDTMDEGTLLTYQVYGWYAESSKTLLDDVKQVADLPAKLKELGWALKDISALTDVPGIVFHAMVQSVVWKSHTASPVPSLSKIDIGIGNTTSEALASLLSLKTVTGESTIPHKLLAAYQFKSMQDRGIEGRGLELLQKQVHARSFSPVDGGTYFAIQPEEKQGAKPQADKDTSGLPFPAEVSECLAQLNDMQRKYDDKVNELTSLQATLYALRFKKAFGLSVDRGTEGIPKDELIAIQAKIDESTKETRARIKALILELDSAKKLKAAAIVDLAANSSPAPARWPADYKGLIVDKYNELLKLMQASKMKEYVISDDVPMPKYFEPADPSIAISGLNPPEKYYKKGVSTLKSYLNAEKAGTSLKCRLSSQTANQIKARELTTTAMDVAAVSVNDFIDELTDKLPSGVAQVFTEAILLNLLLVNDIASSMSATPADIYKIIKDFTAYAPNFTRVTGGKTGAAYLPEAFAVNNWKQPWNPLYLEWMANWESTYNKLSPDVLSAWSLGDDDNAVDFIYDPLKMTKANKSIVYSGRTLLSLQSANKIMELNEKMNTHFKANLFENFIPMTQTLGGFSAQLIQRGHSVQLPILNKEGAQLVVDNDDYKLINKQNAWSPMIVGKSFYPVRSGKLKIEKLRIIDSFGQVLEKQINAASFKATADEPASLFASSAGLPTTDDKYTFALLPRIVQPARLLFNWRSANHLNRITDSDPATSPVCGWLLYNKLDNNLSVFDAKGKEIGLVVKDAVTKKVKYILPPGAFGLLKINNEALNNVVKFIVKSNENFEGITTQISEVIKKIQAKQSRQEITMSLPTGFPMAVVTAQFLVELKELRATDQSWRGSESSKKFSDIDFKLSIGNAANKTDGLTGYFIKDNYNEFILPSGDKDSAHGFTTVPHVEFETGILERLTLIMDPRTMVSISSHILPMGNYELPQEQVSKALKNINLRILAAPFITPLNKIKVPLLQGNDIGWDFINPKTKTVNLTAGLGASQVAFDDVYAAEGWLRIKTGTPEEDKPTNN